MFDGVRLLELLEGLLSQSSTVAEVARSESVRESGHELVTTHSGNLYACLSDFSPKEKKTCKLFFSFGQSGVFIENVLSSLKQKRI